MFSCCTAKPAIAEEDLRVGEDDTSKAPEPSGEPPPARSEATLSLTKGISTYTEGEPEESTYDGPLCKFACGKAVQPGKTRRGNPFDTCCRACALNKGLGVHDATCGGATPTEKPRQACKAGARCRDRSDVHLKDLAHPLDDDYAAACSVTKDVEASPLTLKVLFDWTDADGSGKLSREELEVTLEQIKKSCGAFLPSINDAAWEHLDEDGNGVVNFSEFAAWAGPRLGLPLGIQKSLGKSASMAVKSSPCSVLGCPCESFEGEVKKGADTKCKNCKHKHGLHQSKGDSTAEVPYPDYWDNHEMTTKAMVECKYSVDEFQQLVDKTYLNKFTQDRKRHNPTKQQVPKGFKVLNVFRNENCTSWFEYGCRRAEVMHRIKEEGHAVDIFSDVKSMVAWREIGGAKADRLLHECNEWYLFHGTNPAAARAICDSDFKVSRAGSSTGTLYGKGLYFAESITKADEYAKPNEHGNYAVLLCRIIGGKVLYTDAVTPDPEMLCYSCIEGDYDCVLGDREKTRGTFREFVLFDSEDVYPEYVIEYQRKY